VLRSVQQKEQGEVVMDHMAWYLARGLRCSGEPRQVGLY
jgi:hypothetical protein